MGVVVAARQLAEIILQALAKERDRRFPRGAACAGVLAPSGPRRSSSPAASRRTSSGEEDGRPARRRHAGPLAVGGRERRVWRRARGATSSAALVRLAVAVWAAVAGAPAGHAGIP